MKNILTFLNELNEVILYNQEKEIKKISESQVDNEEIINVKENVFRKITKNKKGKRVKVDGQVFVYDKSFTVCGKIHHKFKAVIATGENLLNVFPKEREFKVSIYFYIVENNGNFTLDSVRTHAMIDNHGSEVKVEAENFNLREALLELQNSLDQEVMREINNSIYTEKIYLNNVNRAVVWNKIYKQYVKSIL